jgi:hypothetical protein
MPAPSADPPKLLSRLYDDVDAGFGAPSSELELERVTR